MNLLMCQPKENLKDGANLLVIVSPLLVYLIYLSLESVFKIAEGFKLYFHS